VSNAEFFSFLDYIYIALLFFSTVAGFMRGFTRDFLSACAWIGSGIVTAFVVPYLMPIANRIIQNTTMARYVATFASYIGILIISLVTIGIMSKNVKESPLSGVDRAVGVLFGLFRGIGVLACFCFLLTSMEIPFHEYAFVENSRLSTILFDLVKRCFPLPASHTASIKKLIPSVERKLLMEKPPMIKKSKTIPEVKVAVDNFLTLKGIPNRILRQSGDIVAPPEHSTSTLKSGAAPIPVLQRKAHVKKRIYRKSEKVKKRRRETP
jgi:membrane protein required for colicin V production